MAPNPDRLDFLFGMVLVLAVATTWAVPPIAESYSAEPIRPRETMYRLEYWRASSANSPRLPQDRLRGLGCCLSGRIFPVALLLFGKSRGHVFLRPPGTKCFHHCP